MMTPDAPAARRQFRIRIGREQRGANQRETEKSRQQNCEDAPHCDSFYTMLELRQVSMLESQEAL